MPEEIARRVRTDLFYRVNVLPRVLRSLRERPEVIAPLAFAIALP